MQFNPLPEDKILAQSKLKAFAYAHFTMTQVMQSFFDRLENFVGKGEDTGYQHLLLFVTMFSKGFFPRVVKTLDF